MPATEAPARKRAPPARPDTRIAWDVTARFFASLKSDSDNDREENTVLQTQSLRDPGALQVRERETHDRPEVWEAWVETTRFFDSFKSDPEDAEDEPSANEAQNCKRSRVTLAQQQAHISLSAGASSLEAITSGDGRCKALQESSAQGEAEPSTLLRASRFKGLCREPKAQVSDRVEACQATEPVSQHCPLEAEKALARMRRIRKGKGGIRVHTSASLAESGFVSPHSTPSGLSTPAIFHHIPPIRVREKRIDREKVTNSLTIPRLQNLRIKIGSYNIRGQKIIGRLCEMSHLIKITGWSILGLQETKCSGNTMTTLAEGFLLNSSDNPLPNKKKHRGTGLII